MKKILMIATVSIFVLAATNAFAAPVRVSGSFGGSIYAAKPILKLPWGSEVSIPANYAASFSAQSTILPHSLFVFASFDRFWSGGEGALKNSSVVFSGGIGHSISVGYSKVEIFAGLSQYNETFDVLMSDGGSAEIEADSLDGLVGLQLVFKFFDQVSATAGCRLIIRDEHYIESTLDDGRAISVKTNSQDVVVSFGLGYTFGI